MNQRKNLHRAGLALLLLALLTACAGGAEADARTYVQGVLDVTYLGQYDEDYMQLVKSTRQACEAHYQSGLAAEAEQFACYFNAALTPEATDPIVALYQELYGGAEMQIKDVKQDREGGFTVTVEVSPVDLLRQVVEQDFDSYAEEFRARFDAGEFAGASQEEYDTRWLLGIVGLAEQRVDRLGHLETETVSLEIQRDETGAYTLSKDSFDRLDARIIDYPMLEP